MMELGALQSSIRMTWTPGVVWPAGSAEACRGCEVRGSLGNFDLRRRVAEFLDDFLQRLDAAQERSESRREEKSDEQQEDQEDLGGQSAGDDRDQHADQKHRGEIGNDRSQ